MKRRPLGSLLLLLALPPSAQAAPDAGAAGWDLGRVGNLDRVPGLGDEHRRHLGRDGFFLAPQDQRGPSGRKGARTKATRLFHVYERNDYYRFPSLITADVAIDTTHSYFEAVLRDLERRQLSKPLADALVSLVAEAEKVRAGARSEPARAEAARIAAFWAVPLRLLRPKAPLPAAIRDQVSKVVAAVVAASGNLPVPLVKGPLDLTQMRPRGHYQGERDLEAYFRAMSWLGMASFPAEGPHADPAGIALLARSVLGNEKAARGLERILRITAFFAGASDTPGPAEAGALLLKVDPGAATAGADHLLSEAVLGAFRRQLATLPRPRISGDDTPTREVRALGRRAFEDAAALAGLIPPLERSAASSDLSSLIPRSMGGLAAAAVVGSKDAARTVSASFPPAARADVETRLAAAQATIARLPAERWSADAYHGTLAALRALLEPLPARTPPLFTTPAWRTRALQTFAAGWAELRHDTILYGEQLGAECDAPDLEPPPSYVEPLPELYRRLAEMVRGLERRLGAAGLDLQHVPGVVRGPDDFPDAYPKPVAEKTKLVAGLLDFLAECATLELEGKPFDRARLRRLTTLGGEAEWILMSLADTEVLSDSDADMAVIADVFTWRLTGQALEVGVGHPDLIYALVPSPKGPVLARGAVMSYREFIHPASNRLTDEAWRKMIARGQAPPRPSWLDGIYAPAPGPLRPPKTTQVRCGPMSGAHIESL